MIEINIAAFRKRLTEACERYERSAPTVADHCDDLYRRIDSDMLAVTLAELVTVADLWRDEWMHPNYAANSIYKLRDRLKMDTVGHTGF